MYPSARGLRVLAVLICISFSISLSQAQYVVGEFGPKLHSVIEIYERVLTRQQSLEIHYTP